MISRAYKLGGGQKELNFQDRSAVEKIQGEINKSTTVVCDFIKKEIRSINKLQNSHSLQTHMIYYAIK